MVGGWKIDELIVSRAQWREGLLEEADGSILYIDEVNLLDDHIVNIILDVAATGVLVIERDANPRRRSVRFVLVGTMNPEEGTLRPQLLDRFGLMVEVKAENDEKRRHEILRRVLQFDEVASALRRGELVDTIREAQEEDARTREKLERARATLRDVEVPEPVLARCVRLATAFNAAGHRSDYVLALAAQAYAARHGDTVVTREHVKRVAPMVLRHRRTGIHVPTWTPKDNEILSAEVDHD